MQSISHLINHTINVKIVPSAWKRGQIFPTFMNNDEIDKYRPLGILPAYSKAFKYYPRPQLPYHFKPLLSAYLTAYLKHIISWQRQSCSNNHDRTRHSFWSRPPSPPPLPPLSQDAHFFLLAKLSAHGMSESSIELLSTYIKNRKQTESQDWKCSINTRYYCSRCATRFWALRCTSVIICGG